MPKDKYDKPSYADRLILRGLKKARKLEHKVAKTKAVRVVGGAVEKARKRVAGKLNRKKKPPTPKSYETVRTQSVKQGLRRNLTKKEIEKFK
ncbi:MAG: hypothetical protein GY938_30895 [Ketobacter sp.]|nr:hypothetical protein [Ketobacter sp.]